MTTNRNKVRQIRRHHLSLEEQEGRAWLHDDDDDEVCRKEYEALLR
jgi:hypothetical protein